MVLNTIKRNLGKLFLCLLFTACANSQKEGVSNTIASVDSCQLDLELGAGVMVNIGECRFCHLRNDGPRFEKNVPLLIELAAMDSLKMSNFLFVGKHNNMFKKPSAAIFEKRLDSLDNCQKKNLIHFIKHRGRIR